MPTYQYCCAQCGHQLEAVQSFTDEALTTCAECGGALRKQFSSVGVVFKGSGFYRNDSRSEARSATKAKQSKADSTANKSESKSGEPSKKSATDTGKKAGTAKATGDAA